jgi:hypothetical protein
MTGSASFEEAIVTGMEELAQEKENGNLQSGKSRILSVAELRGKWLHGHRHAPALRCHRLGQAGTGGPRPGLRSGAPLN